MHQKGEEGEEDINDRGQGNKQQQAWIKARHNKQLMLPVDVVAVAGLKGAELIGTTRKEAKNTAVQAVE